MPLQSQDMHVQEGVMMHSLVTRVVSISGVNGSSNPAPGIYFPHGDPQLRGEAVFVLNPNNSTMDWSIQLEDDRYQVTQAHMYSPHHKPNGDSIFCWGGRWSDHEFLVGAGFSLSAHQLQEMIDTPGPYLLDIMVPHQEHVLPMIPGG